MSDQNQSANIVLAEQLLLGGVITNPILIEKVVEFLKAEHFSVTIHQEIYRTLLQLMDSDVKISIVSVHNVLQRHSKLQELGGIKYLEQLLAASILVFDIYDYGKIIYDHAIKQQLITVSTQAIESAKNSSIVDDYKIELEKLEGKIHNLVTEDYNSKGFVKSGVIVNEVIETINIAIKRKDGVVGIPSELKDLDNKLGGFKNTDLIILAGRPSMGKTAFALNLAVNACMPTIHNQQVAVGFFSLEMSSPDLINRVISMRSNIDSARFTDGKIDQEAYNKIQNVAKEVSKAPLFIDDSPALTISAIRNRARKLKRQCNLGLLIIDYLQLIQCTEKMDNRTLEVSEISRALKALAKELSIPIIALSQLSRAVEQRGGDKKPMLSDLRDSGSIEQDADIVMFIYREEYYLKGKEPELGTAEHAQWMAKLQACYNSAEIMIAKNRKGPTGNVKLYYDCKSSRFKNLS